MSYAPDGVPSWTLTSNLMLRTHLLCNLNYGDQLVQAKVVRVAGLAPALSKVWASYLCIGLHADDAHGRVYTGTVRVLRAPSLPWTTWVKWCRVREFHPQPLRSERSASGSWANAALKLVHPAGLSPANSPFEAEDDHNFTTDAQMACRAEAVRPAFAEATAGSLHLGNGRACR